MEDVEERQRNLMLNVEAYSIPGKARRRSFRLTSSPLPSRNTMNTLIRHKVRQWLGLDRQEDRCTPWAPKLCNKNTT